MKYLVFLGILFCFLSNAVPPPTPKSSTITHVVVPHCDCFDPTNAERADKLGGGNVDGIK